MGAICICCMAQASTQLWSRKENQGKIAHCLAQSRKTHHITRSVWTLPFYWSKFPTRIPLTANPLLDTPKSVVAEITYKPPPLPTSITAPVPKPALESAYINSLFNPSPIPFDESQPMDVHLVKELSNPHSRAKKQARWQQFQRYKVNLRKEMVSKELKNLKGRNARDATAEAMYKWRQVIEDEKKAKQKARWMTKERVAKFERKNKSKQKKTRRQNERLRDLVLADAPNQVLPKLQQASMARVS